MAITWRNVAGPSFGSANVAIDRGMDRLSAAGKGIQGFAEDQAAKQYKDKITNFQSDLMGLAGDPNLNNKEILRDALRKGEEYGLSAEEVMPELERTAKIREMQASFTPEQAAQVQGLNEQIALQEQQGQELIDLELYRFDQENPQLKLSQAELDAFQTSGGLGPVFSELQNQILKEGDQGDAEKTISRINELREKGNYSDFAIAKTIKEMGIKEDNWWRMWDSNRLDDKELKRNLLRNEDYYNNTLKNAVRRREKQQNLQQSHRQNLLNLKNMSRELQKQYRDENLKVFSS